MVRIKSYSDFRLRELIEFEGNLYSVESIWYLPGGLKEYEVKLWV